MHPLLLASILLVGTSALAHEVPHLDLEMSSAEYQIHLKQMSKNKSLQDADDPGITPSLKLGERLSKWITVINASRPATSAIRLTSAATRVPIPIDSPRIYNPVSIKAEAEKLVRALPESMRTVLLSHSDLPANPGIDDTTFITHARLLDRNYQQAARYKSLNPYRMQYTALATKDVRGFYYLMKFKIGPNQLKEVSAIPASEAKNVRESLVTICMNSRESQDSCRNKVDVAWQLNSLVPHYQKYLPYAQSNWNTFFVIPPTAVRKDVQWSANRMVVPFNTPTIAKFIPYLQNNIQDEFRLGTWGLFLNFGSFANGPKLVFQPGVVPHVNGLGGNQIVMDANQPIEEYESQWTIRHEFGHVIGLPDCYHEFYDTKLGAFVNYQLDTTDLMCSRAGNMNERIYKELERVYKK